VAAMQSAATPGHLRFGQAQSALNQAQLAAADLAADVLARFTQQAQEALQAQAAIEAADTQPFEAFRQDYMSAQHLGV